MKIFKSKNFKALIYSIFLSLPILTILGRTIYTIANKNAKDSYYGENINQEINVNVDSDSMELDNTYFFTTDTNTYQNSTRAFIYATNIVNLETNQVIQADSIQFSYGNPYNYLAFYNGSTYVNAFTTNETHIYSISFEFVSSNNIQYFPFQIQEKQYNKYSYLDNAFEYSIDKFTQDNNFGKLNFFQWFSDLFLNNNQTNNLYIHFVNWYMNYILYVSLAYLLFAVLMWFVNFFRSLVEKNMDLDL